MGVHMFGLEKIAGGLKRAFGGAAPREPEKYRAMNMDDFYVAAVAEDARYALAQLDPVKSVFAGGDMRIFVVHQIAHHANLFGGITAAGAHFHATNHLMKDMADFEDRTGLPFPATIKESLAQLIERDGFTPPSYLQEGRVHKGKGGTAASVLGRGLNSH